MSLYVSGGEWGGGGGGACLSLGAGRAGLLFGSSYSSHGFAAITDLLLRCEWSSWAPGRIELASLVVAAAMIVTWGGGGGLQ